MLHTYIIYIYSLKLKITNFLFFFYFFQLCKVRTIEVIYNNLTKNLKGQAKEKTNRQFLAHIEHDIAPPEDGLHFAGNNTSYLLKTT